MDGGSGTILWHTRIRNFNYDSKVKIAKPCRSMDNRKIPLCLKGKGVVNDLVENDEMDKRTHCTTQVTRCFVSAIRKRRFLTLMSGDENLKKIRRCTCLILFVKCNVTSTVQPQILRQPVYDITPFTTSFLLHTFLLLELFKKHSRLSSKACENF